MLKKERHLIDLSSLSKEKIDALFAHAEAVRSNDNSFYKPLSGKSITLLFELPSLRTRVSFERAVTDLGGNPIVISGTEIGLGSREEIADITRTLCSYTDGIVARIMEHETLVEMSKHSSVPVVNALTQKSHPCQILADCYTLWRTNRLDGKIVYIGDYNNIARSWEEMASVYPLDLTIVTPYAPKKKANVKYADNIKVVRNADVLYTDVWFSMGDENSAKKFRALKPFQVNEELLAKNKKCVVMHCLPAHRGEEITSGVMEGSHSIIWQQAENRFHIQKSILSYLFNDRL